MQKLGRYFQHVGVERACQSTVAGHQHEQDVLLWPLRQQGMLRLARYRIDQVGTALTEVSTLMSICA